MTQVHVALPSVAAGVLLLSTVAAGAPEPPVLNALPTGAAVAAALDGEPTLGVLQRAALEAARLGPDRLRGLEARLRASALLPQLRVRVGRGTGQLQTLTDYDGTTRLSVGDRDGWQVDVSASWSLDRLVFHPDELRLAREVERTASHREHLLREVAELYAERQRLRLALLAARSRSTEGTGPGAGSGSGSGAGAGSGSGSGAGADLALRLVAVSGTLDALTGGALGRVTERATAPAAARDGPPAPAPATAGTGPPATERSAGRPATAAERPANDRASRPTAEGK